MQIVLVCIMRSALCRLMVYFFLHSQKHPNAGIITPLASISCPEIRSVYMPSSSLIHAPEEIITMNWLAENVVGKLPEFDELTEEAQSLVRLQGLTIYDNAVMEE